MLVKLCRNCRHSMPEPGSEWNLRCMNAEVNKRDPLALAGSKEHGSNARDEREKRFIGACGMSGKLWSPPAPKTTSFELITPVHDVNFLVKGGDPAAGKTAKSSDRHLLQD